MSDIATRPGKHRARKPADASRPGTEPVGKDGLTDSQRRHLLQSFRSGIGSKPGATGEAEHRSQLVMDKLVDAPIRRKR